MSQPSSNNSQSRQSTSYPSPHSYPSPSMSAYAYPPPQQTPQQPGTPQSGAEPYRASPTASHVSLPSLNLPPIRSIDPQQAQQQAQSQQVQAQVQAQQQQPPQARPQPPGQAPMGSPLPPPVAPMGVYYPPPQPHAYPPPGQHPGMAMSPHSRYPIPAPDGRIMSGGRHKKEIKRRTKTGCLTCRKRRIKCDEAHPTCRNCQKSKRECLGYDPIFKSQPGPAAIQPAPSTVSAALTAAVAPQMPPAPSPYAPPPHGYAPAVSAAYAPALPTGVSSPATSVEPYDYAAAIDPALEASAPPLQVPPTGYESVGGYRPDLKGVLGSASPYSAAATDTQNQRGGATPPQPIPMQEPSGDGWTMNTGIAYTPAKPIKIDDLLAAGGDVPSSLVPPPGEQPAVEFAPATVDRIKEFFTTVYAPAIDRFLESRWFQVHGLARLVSDKRLFEMFGKLIESIQSGSPHIQDLGASVPLPTFEARIVWHLITMCRSAAPSDVTDMQGKSASYDPEVIGLQETICRVVILEHLLNWQKLEKNPLGLTEDGPKVTQPYEPQRVQERDFWRLMGEFLTLRDDEGTSANTLSACRNLLEELENRDVIYSIAIASHLGSRSPEFPDNVQPIGNEELSPKTKLFVAKKFIEDEAMGKGMTQVIQRICMMATWSWRVAK
ncbi:hypothetical protein L228DRAFT_242866 [Xylona heveae TC161]|uniref:Zn(2)-C6 fungal-type domain-containing protein n=1 Tax=Xylona heveae (strain CBS 132557 / TC161) TaxID=1328760 RepID=A0A165JLV5_XYLHT|nr:hypothetical protein L228DRAFT_242866 [Xylona heveae TC161]KZF26403.1 hypothetical protein L228DRAFT_242866 [Xylona heveae TC161]